MPFEAPQEQEVRAKELVLFQQRNTAGFDWNPNE
jgi:hypothetical protein